MVQKERRRFTRYHAPESFTATGEFPSQREHRLKVKDISVDGLCFVTEVDLSREAVFSLSFEVTGTEDEVVRIQTLAGILWHICEEETSLYTAGAQFLGMKDSDQEILQRFLETLEAKSGG